MSFFIFSMFALALGALFSLFPRAGRGLPGPVLAVTGSVSALISAITYLVGGHGWEFTVDWSVPLGGFHLGMDGLSAFFIMAIALISGAAAVYGTGYLKGLHGTPRPGASWFFFNLLVLSMFLVVCSRNGFLFLLSWEVMSLASLFLVVSEHRKEGVIRAGFIYLVATHLGTALLLTGFLLLDAGGNMEFSDYASGGRAASVIFILSLLGFGTKAGLVPLHVWLPEAHPAAPSHVSALMSGVMIKTGIYGILRVLMILGDAVPWWGWTLLLAGAASGILGVLFAIAQHDLKKLLAYHSVENIGIIIIGLGAGTLGIAYHSTSVAVLGFSGSLLHVLNHAVFKSLLFMGAGSVYRATGTLTIDRMGGLLRRMPFTGWTFLTGSAAICGLPPLNGFVSEFLIFSSGLVAVVQGGPLLPAGVVVVVSLALIGTLAAACFTKACGAVFLGEDRSGSLDSVTESVRTMTSTMTALAILCLLLGLGAPWLYPFLEPALGGLLGEQVPAGLPGGTDAALRALVIMAAVFLFLSVSIFLARAALLARRNVRSSTTWGCGYLAPTPRMQYSASSFAQPVISMFRVILRPAQDLKEPEGLWPVSAGMHTHTDDLFLERVFIPMFRKVKGLAGMLRWLHQGQTHYYVLYIALAAFVLLVWRLW